MCAVCIFYTAIGGLKAVVWTDAMQFIVTLASMFAVFVIGVKATGGITDIWQQADAGDRIELFKYVKQSSILLKNLYDIYFIV